MMIVKDFVLQEILKALASWGPEFFISFLVGRSGDAHHFSCLPLLP